MRDLRKRNVLKSREFNCEPKEYIKAITDSKSLEDDDVMHKYLSKLQQLSPRTTK